MDPLEHLEMEYAAAANARAQQLESWRRQIVWCRRIATACMMGVVAITAWEQLTE